MRRTAKCFHGQTTCKFCWPPSGKPATRAWRFGRRCGACNKRVKRSEVMCGRCTRMGVVADPLW